MSRLYDSDDLFPDHLSDAYHPYQSVNFVTAHDGFCLAVQSLFRQFLTYKTERQDQHLMIIGRFFPSSKTCSACGAINTTLTLDSRI